MSLYLGSFKEGSSVNTIEGANLAPSRTIFGDFDILNPALNVKASLKSEIIISQ